MNPKHVKRIVFVLIVSLLMGLYTGAFMKFSGEEDYMAFAIIAAAMFAMGCWTGNDLKKFFPR